MANIVTNIPLTYRESDGDLISPVKGKPTSVPDAVANALKADGMASDPASGGANQIPITMHISGGTSGKDGMNINQITYVKDGWLTTELMKTIDANSTTTLYASKIDSGGTEMIATMINFTNRVSGADSNFNVSESVDCTVQIQQASASHDGLLAVIVSGENPEFTLTIGESPK